MYVQQIREGDKFIEAAEKAGQTVTVSERALAMPVREQQAIVVRAALQRHYTVETTDDLGHHVRLIFSEHLLEHDGKIPLETSLYEELKKKGLRVVEIGRVSRPHAA